MDLLEFIVRSATGYEAYGHYHVSLKEGHMSLIKVRRLPGLSGLKRRHLGHFDFYK